MDTPPAGASPTTNLRPAHGGAGRGPAPDLGPGWLVLRNCALGGGGPRVGLALLHPGVGVALVDSDGGAEDAADRLRRALDARRFPAIFGGYPPIARVALPAGRSGKLGRAVAAAFEAQPPLALAGGDAWIGTARAALEAETPAAAPERHPAQRRRASRWRRGLRRRRGAAAVLAVAAAGASAAVLALVSLPPGNGAAVAPARRQPAAATTAAAPQSLFPEAPPRGPGPVARPGTDAEDAAAAIAPRHAIDPPNAAAAAHRGSPESATREPPATGIGEELAAGPQEGGGAAAAPAAASEESSEPSPAPRTVAAEAPPVAAGVQSVTLGALPVAPAAVPEMAAAPIVPPPQPQKRAAAIPGDAALAPATPPSGNRRAAASPANGPPAGDAGRSGGRCRDILLRATMGEAITDGELDQLRRGCPAQR